MKKALLSFLFLFSVLITQAQDTTVVQTLRWEDDFRAGTFTFPDESPDNWAKIIMLYNMRCHDLAVGNGAVGCREWERGINHLSVPKKIQGWVRRNVQTFSNACKYPIVTLE